MAPFYTVNGATDAAIREACGGPQAEHLNDGFPLVLTQRHHLQLFHVALQFLDINLAAKE